MALRALDRVEQRPAETQRRHPCCRASDPLSGLSFARLAPAALAIHHATRLIPGPPENKLRRVDRCQAGRQTPAKESTATSSTRVARTTRSTIAPAYPDPSLSTTANKPVF